MKLAYPTRNCTKRLWRRPLRQWARTCEWLESRLALTGELTFAEPIVLPTGTNPEAMTTADLDGDGWPDLVTADFADGTVTLHYGQGNAQFSAPRYHFVGRGPADVVAADLDGRHGLDLITANLGTGDVGTSDTSVLLSSGIRTFEDEVFYETGDLTTGVSLADVDDDGMLDLLVAANGIDDIGTVSLLVNDPAAPGDLLPPVTILEKWGANSVVVGDFDENDSWDLALTSDFFGDNDVAVLLHTADGGFAAAGTYQAGLSPDQILTADLNQDGHLDLAVNNWLSDDLSVFLGRGDGTFERAVTHARGLADGDVAIADMDGDGHLDLVTAGGGNRVSVLTGRGDGTFEAPVSFPVDGSPTGVAVADFDGDGRLDLAVCTQEPSTVQLLLSTTAPVVELIGAGDTHVQDFDAALGADGDVPGTDLPAGWTAVITRQERRTISASYPPEELVAEAYNAGPEGGSDRSLALGDEGSDALSQLQLAMEVTDEKLCALTLAFDLEVWAGDPAFVVEAGEAAFQVTIQSQQGGRWVPLADLGVVTTGPALQPSDTIVLDGNTAPNQVHFESSIIDAHALPGTLLRIDFSVPAGGQGAGYVYGLDNVQIQTLYPGDATGDGVFDSADIVHVFQAGEYEDALPGNSTFAEGDWNGDHEFDSSDMVLAFQIGRYELQPRSVALDVAAAVDWYFFERGCDVLLRHMASGNCSIGATELLWSDFRLALTANTKDVDINSLDQIQRTIDASSPGPEKDLLDFELCTFVLRGHAVSREPCQPFNHPLVGIEPRFRTLG